MADQSTTARPRIAKLATSLEDEDPIRDIARAALAASGYRAVAQLKCDVVQDAIILSGVVSSYYMKQVAQETIRRLKLPWTIQNAVHVRS